MEKKLNTYKAEFKYNFEHYRDDHSQENAIRMSALRLMMYVADQKLQQLAKSKNSVSYPWHFIFDTWGLIQYCLSAEENIKAIIKFAKDHAAYIYKYGDENLEEEMDWSQPEGWGLGLGW